MSENERLDPPDVQVNPGSVVVTGHRWRVEILLESGMYRSPEGARALLMFVTGSGGGDASDGTVGELGGIGEPVQLLFDPAGGGELPRGIAAEVEVGRGGYAGMDMVGDALQMDGQRGHDGIALAFTRW